MSHDSHWLNATLVQKELPHSFLHLRVRIATKKSYVTKDVNNQGKMENIEF